MIVYREKSDYDKSKRAGKTGTRDEKKRTQRREDIRIRGVEEGTKGKRRRKLEKERRANHESSGEVY